MMKLIGKLQNGMTFTEEFDGVNDFLALQQSDYNAIADEIEVVEVKLLTKSLILKAIWVNFTMNS